MKMSGRWPDLQLLRIRTYPASDRESKADRTSRIIVEGKVPRCYTNGSCITA